jgi:oligopeptide/dipeptide ABC transporter ATP-binding protein
MAVPIEPAAPVTIAVRRVSLVFPMERVYVSSDPAAAQVSEPLNAAAASSPGTLSGTGMASTRDGEPEPLLVVEDLHVEFRGERTVRAVRGLNYQIAPGEVMGLVGESGSGKSVSAQALLGLLPKRVAHVPKGSARFEGKELLGMAEGDLRKVRGARIAMIFQDPLSSLNPVLTVGRQITEALEEHTDLSGNAAQARAIELLKLVGIPGAEKRVDDHPHQFSGGMRQRAMIAIALSCEPSLLIADEPTTALDVTIQAQILDLLQRLRKELGMAVLIITHDLGVVAGFADRLAVMYAGRVVEIGTTTEVLTTPSQPYTIGLLRSLARLDRPRQAALTPIEGSPPDLSAMLEGCPFAPRCAWRVPDCWNVAPVLEAVKADDAKLAETHRGHGVACHHRPTPADVIAGKPEDGFVAAPPPGTVIATAQPAGGGDGRDTRS